MDFAKANPASSVPQPVLTANRQGKTVQPKPVRKHGTTRKFTPPIFVFLFCALLVTVFFCSYYNILTSLSTLIQDHRPAEISCHQSEAALTKYPSPSLQQLEDKNVDMSTEQTYVNPAITPQSFLA